MQKTLNTILLILFVSIILSAQNNRLNYEDIKYYYVFRGELMDVRSQTPVIPNKVFGEFKTAIFHKTNSFLTYWDHSLITINREGKHVNSIPLPLQSVSSPDYKTNLFWKEGDLWSAKISFSVGKLTGEKRLTQLGNLANPAVCNWYKDHILLYNNFQQGVNSFEEGLEKRRMVLQLDSKIGNLEESIQYDEDAGQYVEKGGFLSIKPKSDVVSPNRRYYLIEKNAETPIVLDMEDFTRKPLSLPPLKDLSSYDRTFYFCSWASDVSAIIWAGNLSTSKIYKTNWESGVIEELFESNDGFNINKFRSESNLDSRNRSHNISLDGGHILIPLAQEAKNTNYMIMRLQNTGLKLINPQVVIGTKYQWISNDAFIYLREGDIKTQGTWLYSIKTMHHTRLTPYLFDECITLPAANKVMFTTTNYYLFETDLIGSTPKQIGSTPYSTWSFFLQNFDPIIDSDSFTASSTGTNNQTILQKPSGAAVSKKGYVQTKLGSNLRLRSEPSDQSNILSQIPNGSQVNIIGEDNKLVLLNGENGKWLKVEYNGVIGWVWGNFIKKE